MEHFKFPDRKIQPDIKCLAYFSFKNVPVKSKSWCASIFTKEEPKFTCYGWIETDDNMGFLRPNDVIFIGERHNDPNGVELFIEKLTSHNSTVRTYEVNSTKPISATDFKNKNIYKLFTTYREN